MKSFDRKIAIVTGGGTGMGRELVVQLAAEGCSVATCDVNETNMAETKRLADTGAPDHVTVSTHVADVSSAADIDAFRDEVLSTHSTNHVNLVFNNAGVGGGGSFISGGIKEWDRTFDICWGGVYNGCRAFVPLLIASDEGYLVNTSSVNGFWAALGPGVPHTAYSAAKFAVKGFTEALIEDFRVNAPHVKVAVVMPGHIGTDIVINSRSLLGMDSPDNMRATLEGRGVPTADMTDEQILEFGEMFGTMFRENAPMTAAQAATVILDGVKAGHWRILIGDDARKLDEAVRADPLSAYGADGLSLSTIIGG